MPKTINNVWSQITSFSNLLRAYKNARRSKRFQYAVAEFELHLENRLFSLQRQLVSGNAGGGV